MEKKPVVEIDFAELSDGSLVEMIEDPADATRTALAVYCNRSAHYTASVEDQGRILVPLSRDDQDLRHVRLACGIEAYGHFLNLERKVAWVLCECLDLQPQHLVLMTAFVISTWFPEKLPVAPYLALVGPPGSGKTTAMRVLSSLCYRALLTADTSSSAFYEISHRIRPTILIDETLTAGRSRELIHLLKASSTPDFVSLRANKARLAYGSKVFSWLELPDDQPLNSRCVILPMHRTSRTDLKVPNDPEVLACAKKVRMCLLQLRFERFGNLPLPKVPLDVKLSGRPLDLYRALALPFDQQPLMCGALGNLIAQQDKLQMAPLSPAQTSTLRVLYFLIHTFPNVPGFTMSDLTADVNADLGSCGEPGRVTERKLGDILTSLSFTNRTRKSTGYVLWMDRAFRERLHASARHYGVEETDPAAIEKCDMCAQTGASSPASVPHELPIEEGVGLKGSQGERHERHERRPRGTRMRASASDRSRTPRFR